MWRAFLILHFLIIISFSPAWAEKRVALVIGNAAYEHTTRLNNPPKDAPDMAAALERIGFDVELKSDLGYAKLRKAIRYFGKKARGAEMAIIYYAGHGMELGGQNWLIPTDAKLLSDEDMEDEALSLNYVMGKVEGTGTLALVILDACRDNPFKRSMKQVRGASRSVSRGLSRVEPEGNLLVAFAARDGTIALDGTPGANSPYASAWLKHMATPGLDIRLLLGRIRDEVKDQSKKLGRYVQEPFFYGSLPGTRIELVPGKKTPTASQADTNTSDEKFEKMQQRLQELEAQLKRRQQVAVAKPPPKPKVEKPVKPAVGIYPPKAKPLPAKCPTKAGYAIVTDAVSGATLCETNANELVPPASMGKLMTLAVIFDRIKKGTLKLDDEFVISENAWRKGGAPSGTAAMFAPLNTRIKLGELLKGIIVQSGNDACIALAEGISGSEAAFAKEMNAYAKKIGLKKSQFRNSTGRPDPDHLMTVRDLALLAGHIIKEHPELYKLFRQKKFRFRKFTFFNRNPLINANIGVDGLKAGYTKEVGFGIVVSSLQRGRRLIVVVHGLKHKKERRTEAHKLLAWGYRR